jgi:hypothetical protein
MSILQTVPQLPSNLQLSQSTGVIIAIGLAVLIIIIAVALVRRHRKLERPSIRKPLIPKALKR